MKKRLLILLFMAVASFIFYLNDSFMLDYDVNIIEYMEYRQAYTEEEEAILSKYSPLIFGGNFFEPPLGKFYEDTNQYVGFMMDYTNALSIELETDIIIKPMIWSDALEALKNEETNLCDMVPSEERAVYYAFSDRLYDLNGIVLKPQNRVDIEELKDLKEKKVAVQEGDYIIDAFKERVQGVVLVPVDNMMVALELLVQGDVDAIAGDDIVIKALINDPIYTDQFEVLNEPLYESMGVIAVPKNQSELIPIIDKAIFKIKRAEIDDKIHTKWFNTTSQTFSVKLQRVSILIVIYLLIGILFVMEYNNRIRNLVEERTEELQETTFELSNVLEHIRSTLLLVDQNENILKSNLKDEFSGLSILSQVKDCLMDSGYTLNEILEDIAVEYNYNHRYYIAQVIPFKNDSDKRLIIVTDVTTEKIQEQKISHSNKMEAVGRLAAGVAHEIRNPLGIIRNSNFLLKEFSIEDEHAAEIIDSIDDAVNRTNKIIENLLEYSKNDEHLLKVVNFKTFIEDTIVFYRTSIKRKNIGVKLDIEEDMIIRINCTSLRHILINLLSNSIDAKSKSIEISGIKKEDKVYITVKDDGGGIDPKKLAKVFDPFFTTKPVGEGTGLGLFIVYNEVQKLGGTIEVFSDGNSGCSFKICIPDLMGDERLEST